MKNLKQSMSLLIIIIIFIIIMIWNFTEIANLKLENKKLKYALRDYAILNCEYVTIQDMQQDLINTKNECNKNSVPELLILAIEEHEKGLGTNWWGVKRIAIDIQKRYPIEKWQLVMAIRIVKQEMEKFAQKNNYTYNNEKELLEYINKHKKNFVYFLQKRYNANDINWAKSVYLIWNSKSKKEKGGF